MVHRDLKPDLKPDDLVEPLVECISCHAMVPEVCGGECCPGCHVSITWEDCTSGTSDVANLRRLGHGDEELRALYPNAAQWRTA